MRVVGLVFPGTKFMQFDLLVYVNGNPTLFCTPGHPQEPLSAESFLKFREVTKRIIMPSHPGRSKELPYSTRAFLNTTLGIFAT